MADQNHPKRRGLMEPNVWTALFLVATVFAVGAYDIYCGMFLGSESTVSAVIQRWSREYPAFCLAFGFVLGHLFWTGPKGRPGAGAGAE